MAQAGRGSCPHVMERPVQTAATGAILLDRGSHGGQGVGSLVRGGLARGARIDNRPAPRDLRRVPGMGRESPAWIGKMPGVPVYSPKILAGNHTMPDREME